MTLTAFARQTNIFPINSPGSSMPVQPLVRQQKSGTASSASAAINPASTSVAQGQPSKQRKGAIPEGVRNTTLSHKAGQLLKRYGDTAESRRRFDEVCLKCEPRLDINEENTIYQSAQQFFHNVIEKSPAYKPADQFGAPPFAIPTVNADRKMLKSAS